MGKVVKYCTNCEEGFAEKFLFCPNCAGTLVAYEMSPLGPQEIANEPPPAPVHAYTAPETLETTAPEMFDEQPAAPTILTNFSANDDVLEIEEPEAPKPTMKENVVEAPIVPSPRFTVSSEPITLKPDATLKIEPAAVPQPNKVFTAPPTAPLTQDVIEEPVVAPPPPVIETPKANYIPAAQPVYQQTKASNADEKRSSNKKLDDDGFYSVTLVQEKNAGTRRMLLIGAALFVFTTAIGALVYDIYSSNADVAALNDDLNSIVYVNDEPPAEEPEIEKPKNEDKGGGGGGGGNKEPTPTSKGALAPQSEKPQIPPSAHMDKVTNPELVLKPETQGNRKEVPTAEKYGDPNSRYDVASDGTGSGGGQGSGTGRGQGSGRGTGAGSGDGSGNGSGIGRGNGNGRGDGGGDDPPPAPTPKPTPKPTPPPPAGPTEAMKILSKPRANYTDAARQNQVQGTVTLRVTFLANGSIGGIAPVNGLPNGLTEQAIAAARGIRFEPAKVNGVAQTVTKQVQYSFTLY